MLFYLWLEQKLEIILQFYVLCLELLRDKRIFFLELLYFNLFRSLPGSKLHAFLMPLFFCSYFENWLIFSIFLTCRQFFCFACGHVFKLSTSWTRFYGKIKLHVLCLMLFSFFLNYVNKNLPYFSIYLKFYMLLQNLSI